MDLVDRLVDAASRRLTRIREDRMIRRFGGIQWCPWCRQVAQNGDGWEFTQSEEDPALDVLTCGVCGGTSHWLWGWGYHYVGPLAAPAPRALSILPHPVGG